MIVNLLSEYYMAMISIRAHKPKYEHIASQMIVLDKYSYRAYIIYSKSVKLLRLELYGNDIYTSTQAII